MKINVSLSKKIGQPNYGSLGASCGVEMDCPDDVDDEEFQRRVRAAFSECAEAIVAELEMLTEARIPPY